MKKFLAICSLALLGSISFSSFAAEEINLRDEMMLMAQGLSSANRANSSEEFQQNMKTFIDAAEKAKVTPPAKWQGDTSQLPGYQQGLQKVIDVAQEASNLAKQNKLDEAKMKLDEMPELRKMYHTLYK